MVDKVNQVPQQLPIVDKEGKQTQVAQLMFKSLVDRSVIIATGSPEGVVEALPGALYMDDSGTTGSILYIKKTGKSNTGWILV